MEIMIYNIKRQRKMVYDYQHHADDPDKVYIKYAFLLHNWDFPFSWG